MFDQQDIHGARVESTTKTVEIYIYIYLKYLIISGLNIS